MTPDCLTLNSTHPPHLPIARLFIYVLKTWRQATPPPLYVTLLLLPPYWYNVYGHSSAYVFTVLSHLHKQMLKSKDNVVSPGAYKNRIMFRGMTAPPTLLYFHPFNPLQSISS